MAVSNFLVLVRDGLFVVAFALWVNAMVRYFSFYRAWNHQYRDVLGPIAVEVLTPLNLFWRKLSPELKSKRRKYVIASCMFVVSLAAFFASMFVVI